MKKAIITVVGKDSVGIIAGVCTFLAKNNINILDISQTIVNGYFNMMMVVDVSGIDDRFLEVSESLAKMGEETLGVVAKIQREEIFDKMHRI
ncbi:MAG: ACT domain-containing protein [Lachnospiraceae bacterium]|jgi:ACT domain-containing protein|nr:ACT domain-containing protein [Lachnospiraceae bacterium]MCR4779426.1 ACT domain-containing protein [Lachnospiraceae bacterium]